jgi:uncharacterized protein (TIGR02145 family)
MIRLFIEDSELDVNQDFSNQITYSIDDIENLDSKTTAFSKTIVLPGTANNNKLLGNIFDIRNEFADDNQVQNIGYNFNASRSAKARLESNGLQIMKGVLRVLEIIIDGSNIEYEVALFGELGGFVSKLGTKKLEDLDFSAYDGKYDTTEITNSWNTIDGNGLYYPLIDYGNCSVNKHDYSYKAFKPAFYVREMMDKIITNAGYTWESNFFNTDFFKRLIVPNNQKILNAYKIESLNITKHYQNTVRGITNYGFVTKDVITNYLYLGLFTTSDNITYKWTGQPNRFRLTCNNQLNIYHLYAFSTMDVRIGFSINGNIVYISQLMHTNNNTFDAHMEYGSYQMDYTFDLNTDDEVKFVVQSTGFRYQTFGGFKLDTTVNIETTVCNTLINTLNPILQPIRIGDDLRTKDALPVNVLQKDFFTSIVKMFYLMITEDKFRAKHLIIEPYVDFYNLSPNTYLNWTEKVDRSEPIKIKPMSEINARYYSLKYKLDKDFANDKYRVKYNATYGDYIFDNNLEFAKDTQTTEVVFASTPLVAYEDKPDDKLASSIMKVNNGVEDTTESIIRILQAKKITDVNSWAIYGNTGNIETNLTTYGYAGHLDDPDVPNADLNFGVPYELFFTLVAGSLGNNLFNAFYSSYLAEITDVNSKLFTCKMWLTEKDIFNLNFSKFIWIDGVLYRLNKITDYTPGEKCKVELLKVIYTTYSDVGFFDDFDSVAIGNQGWMQKNLEVSNFKNGDVIREITSDADWDLACANNEPVWAYYNYSSSYADYGKLYNWHAVNDSRGLAPSGWRIPTVADFNTLKTYLGGSSVAGEKLKESGTSHWDTANGTNTSLFTALGSGYCNDAGNMQQLKKTAYFWTSQEDSGNARAFYAEDVNDVFSNDYFNKCNGFSVRCIKN